MNRRHVILLGTVVIGLLNAGSVGDAFGQAKEQKTRTIGPGLVTIKEALVSTSESIKFAPNTTIRLEVPEVIIQAPTIEWAENIVFDLQGADGADGRNISPNERIVWCMAKDHNNWEQEWESASPPGGKRGGDGLPGDPGKDVQISARQHVFSTPGARITFRAAGGHGGRAGKGGLGASFSLKPSGADCDHGTNEVAHKDGPPGGDGIPGQNGDGGHIVFQSRSNLELRRVKIEGGTLVWLVPGLQVQSLRQIPTP